MPRFRSLVAALSIALGLLPEPASAFEFLRLVNSGTPTPAGGGVTFQFFSPPAYRDNLAVFRAVNSLGDPGLYAYHTAPVTVASYFSSSPSGGYFTDFGTEPDTDDQQIVFWATGIQDLSSGTMFEGIYIFVDGGIYKVVDKTTPVPGGTGTFTSFGRAPRIRNGSVIFQGNSSSGQALYVAAGPSSMAPLVTATTLMPGRSETFAVIRSFDMEDSSLAFVGESSTGFRGVYTYASAGSVSKVVDVATHRPGTTTPFGSLGETVALQDTSVVFTSGHAVFARINGTLTRIMNTSTNPPLASETYNALLPNQEVENGLVVFTATTSARAGIYMGKGGNLWTVLENLSAFDGKTAQNFRITNHALANEVLAFQANFSDGTSGLYYTRPIRQPVSSWLRTGQRLWVGGTLGFQVMTYNFTLGTSSVSPYAAAPGAAGVALTRGQWVGQYLYDYASGRFSQAVYELANSGY